MSVAQTVAEVLREHVTPSANIVETASWSKLV